MLTRLALVAAAAALTACGSDAETRVDRAAQRMNALANPALDSARAEGNVLVVRYKPLGLQQLSDAEIARMTGAGLCTLDGVKQLIADKAAIRLEIPRGGRYLAVDLKGCEGDRPILANDA